MKGWEKKFLNVVSGNEIPILKSPKVWSDSGYFVISLAMVIDVFLLINEI